MPGEANVLFLPDDHLSNISSWLDDRDLCMMELASKRFYNALSKSYGPPRTQLNLSTVRNDKYDAHPTKASPRLSLLSGLLSSDSVVRKVKNHE